MSSNDNATGLRRRSGYEGLSPGPGTERDGEGGPPDSAWVPGDRHARPEGIGRHRLGTRNVEAAPSHSRLFLVAGVRASSYYYWDGSACRWSDFSGTSSIDPQGSAS